MSEKKTIRIELTEEQKKLVRDATGKDASAVEFAADELEDRVSPVDLGARRSPTELGIRKSPTELGVRKSPTELGVRKSPTRIGKG